MKIPESEVNIIWPTQGRVLCLLLVCLSFLSQQSFAEEVWTVDGQGLLFYTDDVSYINHYWSVDGDIELTEWLSLQTAFHYEHNIWTSSLSGDERKGAHENIYQGDITLAYWLTDSIQGFGEIQYSSRKESSESSSVDNTNVSIGLTTRF